MATITVENFFSGTLNTVDAVISNFVSTTYQHFVTEHTILITSICTFYIMLLGYKVLFPSHHFNFAVIIKHFIVLLCVYGLLMKWSLYELFIYKVFTEEPGNIAQVFIEATSHASGPSIIVALDKIYLALIKAAMSLFSEIGFSTNGIAFLFYGALVYGIGTVMCVFALLLFVYAKMMMAVILALGPLFVLFLLFDSTKNIFSAWMSQLMTIALIPIVTSAILALMLSIINVTLPALNRPAETLQFTGIAPFLALSLATSLILKQVFKICSSLGSGMTLGPISHAGDIARSAFNKSGLGTIASYIKSKI